MDSDQINESTSESMIDDSVSRSREAHRRHGLAFVASAAAHAIIILALVFLLPEIERPHHDWVLAYLVEFDRPATPGRRGGARDARATSPPASAHDASDLKSQSVISSPKPPHAHRRAARAQAEPERAARQTAALTAAPGTGDAAIAARGEESGVPAKAGTPDSRIEEMAAPPLSLDAHGGAGRGDAATGTGSGSSSAHAEYGQNPVPVYPREARRRAEQGTVLLGVEVAADGSVARVVIVRSSGFDSLDESAIDTVRMRWRFVPARRDGTAVDSWCEVPIRFALTEANAQ